VLGAVDWTTGTMGDWTWICASGTTEAVTALPLTTVQERVSPVAAIIIVNPPLQTIATGRIQVISTIEPEYWTRTTVAGFHRIERHPREAARTRTPARRFVSVTEAAIMVLQDHGRLLHGQARGQPRIARIRIDRRQTPTGLWPGRHNIKVALQRHRVKMIVPVFPLAATVSRAIGNSVLRHHRVLRHPECSDLRRESLRVALNTRHQREQWHRPADTTSNGHRLVVTKTAHRTIAARVLTTSAAQVRTTSAAQVRSAATDQDPVEIIDPVPDTTKSGIWQD